MITGWSCSSTVSSCNILWEFSKNGIIGMIKKVNMLNQIVDSSYVAGLSNGNADGLEELESIIMLKHFWDILA